MPNREKLDKLILIGFKAPSDDDVRAANITDRFIRESANIDDINAMEGDDKLIFYDGLNKPISKDNDSPLTPEGIVRNSFIRDDSQRTGYRIGNSQCIISESVPDNERLKIDRLTKVGITVRSGFANVDFSRMSQTQIEEWFETGEYHEPKEDDEKDLSGQDLVDDLLGYSEDEEESSDNVMDILNSQLSDNEEDSDNDSQEEVNPYAEVEDFEDSPVSKYDSEENKKSSTENTSSISEEHNPYAEVPDEDFVSSNKEDESFNENSSRKEKLSNNTDSVFDGVDNTDYEEMIGGTSLGDNTKNSSYNGSGDSEEYSSLLGNQTEINNDEPVSIESSGDDYGLEESLSSYDTPEFSPREDSRSRPTGKPVSSDSTELIDEFREDRRKAKERERSEFAKAREATKLRQQKIAEQARKGSTETRASNIDKQISSEMESDYNSEGKRKTYNEYLPREASREQGVREGIVGKFGNAPKQDMSSDNYDRQEGMSFVGGNTGRATLVTAGKGGVGKTLFTCASASALSLARAKEREQNPGARAKRVWLIESDYQSPKLRQVYKTRDKHLGNVAEVISSEGKRMPDRDKTIRAIEDNVFTDEETGVNILACPPVNRASSSTDSVPYAIVSAIRYAIDNGGDVFIDHGQLTSGNYNELDSLLAFDMANRVVLVANMSCLNETQATLDLLSGVKPGGLGQQKSPSTVTVMLNSATDEQYLVAQDRIRPYKIMGKLPRIPALAPENSMTGDTYFTNASLDVRKEVIVRVGMMLKNVGFNDLSRYFYENPEMKQTREVKQKRPWFQRITDRFSK